MHKICELETMYDSPIHLDSETNDLFYEKGSE